jgi:hypothetical protein
MTKDLIEDLRLNHEYCPKEVILQAADILEKTLETLKKIANVNAMDYEYQAWAREALKQLNTEETV